MKTLARVLLGLAIVISGMIFVIPANAIAEECDGVPTSILGENGCTSGTDDGSAIFSVLNVVLTVLTYGVGIVGTLGLVISGIQYMTAKDNAGQMAAAKNRIIGIVIGLVAYAILWAFLQWILPGGIFGDG